MARLIGLFNLGLKSESFMSSQYFNIVPFLSNGFEYLVSNSFCLFIRDSSILGYSFLQEKNPKVRIKIKN